MNDEELKLFIESRDFFATQLDAERDIIENSVRSYFFALHQTNGGRLEDFCSEFFNKTSGDQTGVLAVINARKYFVKTHQHGPTNSNPRSVAPPDSKEIFVYKLLELIGIGSVVHYILPIHGMTLYIATEDALFTQLKDLHNKPDSATFQALLQLDLIARILCLSDCTTNETNCGIRKNGEPCIIDFRVLERNDYNKDDIIERYIRGNGEYNYTRLMKEATSTESSVKMSIAKNALTRWSLDENIAKSKTFTENFMTSFRQSDESDLERYVLGISKTIQLLSNMP